MEHVYEVEKELEEYTDIMQEARIVYRHTL